MTITMLGLPGTMFNIAGNRSCPWEDPLADFGRPGGVGRGRSRSSKRMEALEREARKALHAGDVRERTLKTSSRGPLGGYDYEGSRRTARVHNRGAPLIVLSALLTLTERKSH